MGAVGVVHDWLMTSRPVLTIAFASIVLAACGGGDSDGADTTISEITLLTTTTEAPLFEEGDGVTEPPSTIAAPIETVPATEAEVSTTVATAPTADATTSTTASPVAADTTAPPVTQTTPADTAPADTAPTETAPAPIGGGFVLGADGLGAVQFGADPEQTITFVTSMIGAPTADTGWLDPFEIGPCGGTRIRQVRWNDLQLEFGDLSDVTEGRDHFYAYFYGVEGSSTPQPPGLKTAEQIGAGSAVVELIAAYPGATLRQGDEFVGPSFTVNDNLVGRLSGVTDDDVVEAFIGGRPCDG